jgi:competence protein ComEC
MTLRIHRVPALKLSRSYHHLVILLAIALFVFFIPLSGKFMALRESGMRVWFFDVGQGDGMMIETPHGQQILIDGGPDQTILQKLPSIMWPWDRTIEAIFVSHPDADHITGLVSVLEQYKVETIYETGVRGGTSVIAELEQAITNEQTTHTLVRNGDAFEIDGVQIDILWPTQEAVQTEKNRNNTSIVMRVRYGAISLLFTGDAEESVENDFAASAGDVDVLKAGHHGSRTSTSFDLLSITKPEIAIISAGEENRYGHPHPIILLRLKQIGAKIWRTDLDGDIFVFSDGSSLQSKPAFLPF